MANLSFVNKDDLVKELTTFLDPKDHVSDIDLIDFIARRIIEERCPCSYGHLKNQIMNAAFDFLNLSSDELDIVVEQLIDRFLLIGDLLEIDNFSRFDIEERRRLIFGADPSFVFRSHDQIAFLIAPSSSPNFLSIYRDRIEKASNLKFIRQISQENLRSDLFQSGLHEVRESDWLMPPGYILGKSPSEILNKYQEKLMQSSYSGVVLDLQILNDKSGPNFYKARWTSPANLTGAYIARRPSKYGPKTWGYAHLNEGKLQKFIDFPCLTSTGRACDEAWQLLIIKDYLNSSPQSFGLIQTELSTDIQFFSPLPSWIEKYLILFGEKIEDSSALLTYKIPNLYIGAIIDKLRNQFWLKEAN